MELTVTFISLNNYTEGVSANGNAWKRQEAVFETRDNYPKKIAVSAFNSTAETLAHCTPGAIYDIKFDIESREWNGKWYTDVKLSGVTAHIDQAAQPAPQQAQHQAYQPPRQAPQPAPQPTFGQGEDYNDDLPF